MTRLTRLTLIWFCGLCPLALPVQAAGNAKELKAIRAAVDLYVEAFNNQQPEKLAARWSPEGVYVNRTTGVRVSGREAIQQQFEEIFADDEGLAITVEVSSLRLVTDDVAVEEGVATVVERGSMPEKTAYTAIHVKQDGKWLIESIRETVLPTPDSHYDQLKDLEWMIGTWVDQDGDATIETTCAWTKNRNFITRSFNVAIGDQVTLSGTQVIGWDPSAGSVRSWLFDSDGGFAEAVWTRDGDRWIIKAAGVMQDGAKASSVNIITMADDDSFTWQSIGREVGGELLPNIDEIIIVRKQD